VQYNVQYAVKSLTQLCKIGIAAASDWLFRDSLLLAWCGACCLQVVALFVAFVWQGWASGKGYNVSATHSISKCKPCMHKALHMQT
jgi:hypothetical protein